MVRRKAGSIPPDSVALRMAPTASSPQRSPMYDQSAWPNR